MNRFLGFASVGIATVALGVSLFGAHDAPAPAPHEPQSDTRPPAQVQALEQRVQVLEETVQLLSRRLMEVERRPVMASDGGAVVVGAPAALVDEVAKLREEMRGMVAGEALNSEGGRQYLKDMVRSVQEESRSEQRQVWQQQMQQVRAQAQADRDQRVRTFITDAKLDYNQEREVTRSLQAEETKRQALLAEMNAGTKSPRDLRQGLRDLRQQTDTEVNGVLNSEQQQKYTEMRRDEWQDMRPRGGPRPPPAGAGMGEP
ncbi:hypothetical protein KRR26_31015 [Corallococcus sp. M34]|uniref:hypothetical protein n=1 Tax=Citreicoccus inhibens TaxID=2849499 RepID=UPI001C2316A2|nr:hypothetical protein [Citreicoccus inhibens]MBU8900049.1 hypothetical protein [Citreicoccus inhibens]